MGFLSRYQATERVDLGDGFYVVVRQYLTSEQSGEAQRRLMRMNIEETKTEDGKATPMMRSEMDTPGFQRERAVQAVVEWNLTDENDQLLPFEPVEALRTSMARVPVFVVEEISKVLDAPDKEAKQNAASFPEGDSASDTGPETGPVAVDGVSAH